MAKDKYEDIFGDSEQAGKIIPSGLPKCFHSHKALKLGEFEIYGGNCGFPVVKDADIYVSLQAGSISGYATDPWEKKHVIEIVFSINDVCAPKVADVGRFKKMVDYLCNQLQSGKKIHIGCIGGHGRTGLVLSAMAAQLGEKDAIAFIRKNYCDRAVESEPQIKFLMKHYGVPSAEPRKFGFDYPTSKAWQRNTFLPSASSKKYDKDDFYHAQDQAGFGFALGTGKDSWINDLKRKSTPLSAAVNLDKSSKEILPVNSGRNVWKKRKKNKNIDK